MPALVLTLYFSPDGRLRRAKKDYQQQMIDRTATLRPEHHNYSGFSGPWLENRFFEYWQEHKPQVPRIYVPVAWTDCSVKQVDLNFLQALISGLDPAYSYFTVSQTPLGRNNFGYGLLVPRHLDIIVFSAGGDSGPWKSEPGILVVLLYSCHHCLLNCQPAKSLHISCPYQVILKA